MFGDNLSDRFLNFAARILKVADALPKTLAGKHIAGQLIRSGTSAGANYEEARGSESDADFTHKLRIVLKELRETLYWLKLIIQSRLLPVGKLKDLIVECEALAKITAQSLITVKKRRRLERQLAD